MAQAQGRVPLSGKGFFTFLLTFPHEYGVELQWIRCMSPSQCQIELYRKVLFDTGNPVLSLFYRFSWKTVFDARFRTPNIIVPLSTPRPTETRVGGCVRVVRHRQGRNRRPFDAWPRSDSRL